MWGLAIFCGLLRKPMLARGIYYCHWSSSSLCAAQRHKWLTCHTNSLIHKPQLPMPAIFGHRVLQYGEAAKEKIERRAKLKYGKASSNRKGKPTFEDMSKEKISKSKIESRVDKTPKKKIAESKIKPKAGETPRKKNINIKSKIKPNAGETPRQKNINSKMKLKVEETPKDNILKSKIAIQASKDKTGKIKIKSKVQEALKEKRKMKIMKHKVEQGLNGKIIKSKLKPKIKEASMVKNTHSMMKPRIEKTSKEKNMASKIEVKSKVKETPTEKITFRKGKPKVEETSNRKIKKRMKKPKVEKTSKEKNMASKIEVKSKFKATPKEKIAFRKRKPKVEETSNRKINKRMKKPKVEETSKEKSMASKIEVKSKFKETPKEKITSRKEKSMASKIEVKSKLKATPKENITSRKRKPKVEETSNKKINNRMKTPKVEDTSKEKNMASKIEVNSKFKETPKEKITFRKRKPKVEETSNRKINKRMKKLKVEETSKEKSTKSKIKFKVQEAPKENSNMNVHQQVTQVLQEYLYYTRELSFADASHISLNAPSFVTKLLSIFRRQKPNRITSAVQRHLLHNPINEFELFFESIGIEPCDIHGLLPHHCLHLSENQTLLATVSTLTNIGFPRHKLGKLYVEQPHLFSSSTGELQNKLQFYENIGVSKASLVSVLTCCPTLLDDDVYKQFVKVANGLNGFQLEKNRICCLTEENRDIQSSIVEKLMLLVGIGCSWDEISKLYHTKSEIFINSSEEAFYSIIEMFSSLGLRREDIGSFVLQCPEILQSIGLDKKKTLERILHHFHDLHGCQLNKFLEGSIRTVSEKEFSILSGEHNRSTKLEGGKANPEKNHIKLLEGEDLNHRKNAPVLGCSFKGKQSACPREIKINENLMKPISRHKLIFLLKVGLAESAEQIAKVDRKLSVQGDKLQERVNYLLALGFPFNVFCEMVRARPDILQQTLKRLQSKVNFLCSSSPNPIEELELFPAYLCFHLEHRIMPRCKMYDLLKANNMLKRESCLQTIISIPERRFLKRYVKYHPQGEKYFMQLKLKHL